LVSLLEDPSWNIRAAAAKALEQRNYFPETPEDRANYYVPLENWDAVRSVGLAAVKPLISALSAVVPEPDPRRSRPSSMLTFDRDGVRYRFYDPKPVPAQAAFMLAELGVTEAVDKIAVLLKHEEPRVRMEAAAALQILNDPRAVPALLEAMRDSDANVRYNAMQTLRRLNTPEAEAAVVAGLQDPVADNRQAAAQALGEMKAEEAVEPLTRTLGDGDGWVRNAAMQALSQIGGPAAADAVATFLAPSKPQDLRVIAAETLGRMAPEAVPYLIQALNDENEDVQAAAMRALGEIGDPATVEPVAAFLAPERTYENEEQATRVQGYAIRALAKLGPKAIPHLEAFVSEPEPEPVPPAGPVPPRPVRARPSSAKDAARQALEQLKQQQ
jgi:HEAT repeat protein